MREGQYYDPLRSKPLSETDGCSFDDWPKKHADFPFALHAKGFPIFLDPEELAEADEYSAGDPYHMAEGFEQEFQKRRVACTLHLIRLAATHRPADLRILDVGCGEGHITGTILEALPNAKIDGLDYSVSAILYAAEHFAGIEFCVADAYHPPYRSDYFDILVGNNLWEHVASPVSLLRGLRRITKPGGCLILSMPSRYRLTNLARAILGRPLALASPLHVTEYTVGQVIEQLRSEGFVVEQVYSRPMREKVHTAAQFIAHKIVKPFLSAFLKIVASHHCLESTVFFLARKK
jgi:ubiquinone/menaquinone biosynthesis C-methylase UbiE